MQRARVELLGSILQFGTGLGVGQVRRRHVGQRLGRFHVPACQRTRRVAVEVERTELTVLVAQREGEDGRQSGLECPRGRTPVNMVVAEIGHGDGLTGLVGAQARAFADFGLQLLEAQGRIVGRRHVVGRRRRRDQRDTGPGDGKDVDDALHQVIQDALDRKIGGHGACEFTQHDCQLAIRCHRAALWRSSGSVSGYRVQPLPKLYLVDRVGTTLSPLRPFYGRLGASPDAAAARHGHDRHGPTARGNSRWRVSSPAGGVLSSVGP